MPALAWAEAGYGARDIRNALLTPEESPTAQMLDKFYAVRGYSPVWTDSASVLEIVKELMRAPYEGLDPDYYGTSYIVQLLFTIRDKQSLGEQVRPEVLAELDVLITRALLDYAQDLRYGRARRIEALGLSRVDDDLDIAGLMIRSVNAGRAADALRRMSPSNQGFIQLKNTLGRVRNIAETRGWPAIEGPTLKQGMSGSMVKTLADRLEAFGDLEGNAGKDVFDARIKKALIGFQERHRMKADGIAGAATIALLNRPAAEIIRSIELNMERWRWTANHLSERYIMVNLADFTLNVMENNQSLLEMKVITGKTYMETPVFASRMTYLVANPYWNIPYSIAANEILPIVSNDPGYLERNHIRVLKGWGDGEVEVAASDVDWKTVDLNNLDIRFRQDPGGDNPLGAVKFMMPNQYHIYLHDTPAKWLFDRQQRSLSHGCIRLERPLDLMGYLLKGTRYAADPSAYDGQTEINLPEQIDVLIVYNTAWADNKGRLSIRDDIYGRDRKLDALLSGSRL